MAGSTEKLYLLKLIKKGSFLGAFFLIFSANVLATERLKSYRYEFSWGLVPMASLTIDFSKYESLRLITSEGRTSGLSRLFKSYKAKVTLKESSDSFEKNYELQGVDNGVEEVRKINFSRHSLPYVVDFKDSTSLISLSPTVGLDENSVDPLTVFLWFFTDEVVNEKCSKRFRVFDGKKRFLIYVENLKTPENQNSSVRFELSCRITMSGRSLKSKDFLENKSGVLFWPFNKKDQVIDVVVGGENQGSLFVKEIHIHSPIGRIVGKLRS